jgi:hypothetical protein
MVDQLVKHLPDVTHKKGYIKELVQEDDRLFFMIDDVKSIDIHDGSSTSGYEIVNEKEGYEKVKVVQDVKAYVRDGTLLRSSPMAKHFQEDLDSRKGDYKRLFDLYFIEDKLVLAVERYLP